MKLFFHITEDGSVVCTAQYTLLKHVACYLFVILLSFLGEIIIRKLNYLAKGDRKGLKKSIKVKEGSFKSQSGKLKFKNYRSAQSTFSLVRKCLKSRQLL